MGIDLTIKVNSPSSSLQPSIACSSWIWGRTLWAPPVCADNIVVFCRKSYCWEFMVTNTHSLTLSSFYPTYHSKALEAPWVPSSNLLALSLPMPCMCVYLACSLSEPWWRLNRTPTLTTFQQFWESVSSLGAGKSYRISKKKVMGVGGRCRAVWCYLLGMWLDTFFPSAILQFA